MRKMEYEKKKIRINIIKAIAKILIKVMKIFLTICCILFILVVFMQRITDSNGSLGGYRIFTVITGSMLPKYSIGDVVICKEVDVTEIQKGDAIVYKGTKGELSGKIIMHEVIGINEDSRGNISFHTKGTNNNEEDPEVKEEQVYGLVVVKSIVLSILYKLATNIYASFAIILILVVNVFVQFKRGNKDMAQLEEGKEQKNMLENESVEEQNEEKEEIYELEIEEQTKNEDIPEKAIQKSENKLKSKKNLKKENKIEKNKELSEVEKIPEMIVNKKEEIKVKREKTKEIQKDKTITENKNLHNLEKKAKVKQNNSEKENKSERGTNKEVIENIKANNQKIKKRTKVEEKLKDTEKKSELTSNKKSTTKKKVDENK